MSLSLFELYVSLVNVIIKSLLTYLYVLDFSPQRKFICVVVAEYNEFSRSFLVSVKVTTILVTVEFL